VYDVDKTFQPIYRLNVVTNTTESLWHIVYHCSAMITADSIISVYKPLKHDVLSVADFKYKLTTSLCLSSL